MATILTINQIVKMFSDFADSHMMLNDFGFGPTSDIGQSRKMDFSYLWMTNRSASSISIQNRTAIPSMNFTFIIVDQINIQDNYNSSTDLNSDNQQEILSDTFQIAQDLITYIQTDLGKYGIKLTEQDINIEAILDETIDKVSGWVFDIELQVTHSNCAYPTDGIAPIVPSACSDAFVQNSNGSYTTSVNSGGFLTTPDIDITVNGSAFDTIPSVEDYDVTVTDQDGNQVGNKVGTDWVVNIGDIPLNTANILKTGVTISYQTNDDGLKQFGRDIDFFTLEHNNGFGNTNRFTDDLGTQVYTSNVVIDWSTWNQITDKVLAYYLDPLPSSNATITLPAQPYTRNGIADWWVTNIKQLLNIAYFGTTGNGDRYNYPPFNFVQDSSNRLHTSTYIRAGIILVGYETNLGGIANHTTASRAFLCRHYTLTELGL